MFHEYENVFIIRPDLDDAEVEATASKLEDAVRELGGHVLDRDDWGKRKLAYSIAKYTRGHYVLLSLLLSPEDVAELERRMRLDDRIIRFGVFKQTDNVDVEAALAEATERRAAAAARRAAQAAEEAEAANDDDDDDDDNYKAGAEA